MLNNQPLSTLVRFLLRLKIRKAETVNCISCEAKIAGAIVLGRLELTLENQEAIEVRKTSITSQVNGTTDIAKIYRASSKGSGLHAVLNGGQNKRVSSWRSG